MISHRITKITLFIICAAALSLYLIYLPFYFYKFHNTGLIFTVDSFAYLLKSLEVADGNLVPMRTHAIGWPIFASLFFYLLNIKSVFIAMFYGQLLNIFLGVLAIIPTYLIARQFLNRSYSLLTSILLALSFWQLYSALEFFSEPIFTLLLLATVYFAIKSKNGPNFIFISAVTAGFSYWIRPNGIFLLLIIIFSYWLLRRHIENKPNLLGAVITSALLFFIIAAPPLYQRYLTFGSPFFYGENSNYFAENYNQLWTPNQPLIALADYLKNQTIYEIIDRFVIHGAGSLVFSLIILNLPLSLFTIWGLMISLNKKKRWPLIFTIIIFIGGLAPLYAVYFTPRYLFPLLPLTAIFTTLGIKHFLKNQTHRFLIIALIILLQASFLIVGFFYPQYYFLTKRSDEAVAFGRWTAQNLQGRTAIALDQDFIMMNLSDATVSQKGLFDLEAPQSKLSLIYPGYFTNAKKLTDWLRSNQINYLILNSDNSDRINQQLKIYTNVPLPLNYKKIYHNYDNQSSWAVDIYKINY